MNLNLDKLALSPLSKFLSRTKKVIFTISFLLIISISYYHLKGKT